MSDKNYNFENFEETVVYGKHFKDDTSEKLSQKDDFDFEDKTIVAPKIKQTPPVRPVAPPITQDYGDEFYNENDEFVPEVINPYPKYKEPRRPVSQQNYKDEQLKRKNNTIVILTVALVLVVFISLLFMLINSLANSGNKNNDNNAQTPTTATIATEEYTKAPTEEETEEPTEEETEEPTEEETEEPTEEPTDAPTEEQTDAPTEEQTDAPVAPVEE